MHACIFELLCEPSCILSSSPIALSKQSCWPPTRRKAFAWHFHSQIICLSLKIYAMGCNRNGPEPEHLGLCCTAQLCSPGPAPDADTAASAPAPACGGLCVVDLWVCQPAAAMWWRPQSMAWKQESMLEPCLYKCGCLLVSPLVTQRERAVVR